MIRIKVPASSANLGPGFDCFGLALNLYNSFTVEVSDHDELENVEERFNNSDNLFLQSYHQALQKYGMNDGIKARFDCDIPVSRGLGSSSAMIVAGVVAASELHDGFLSDSQIFQLACEIEGHPDNVAPCFYGNLTASMKYQSRFVTHQFELHEDWHYTVLIPDFEVSTEKARSILPNTYERSTVTHNTSCAIYLLEGLRTGSLPLLQAGCQDEVHEPYRKQLIPDFDSLKKICESTCFGSFFISGSGSTCLLISKQPIEQSIQEEIHNVTKANWQIKELQIAHGVEIEDIV